MLNILIERSVFMKNQDQRKYSVCFTGHRPEKLTVSEQVVKESLFSEIQNSIAQGMYIFISGMARGIDLWAADMILKEKQKNPQIQLICAIPYVDFEKKWSASWQHLYNTIINQADTVEYICQKFSYSSFQLRNEWMVNHVSKVIAVWNGEKSGTKNTVLYAEKCGIPVINLYDQFK